MNSVLIFFMFGWLKKVEKVIFVFIKRLKMVFGDKPLMELKTEAPYKFIFPDKPKISFNFDKVLSMVFEMGGD